MAKVIVIFNNKGGVGKTVLCWNLADTLARRGKNILLIDFDPQCNLSIAMLGEDNFVQKLPTQNIPYGTTLRSFLQRFLQNTGGEELFLHSGINTHPNVKLIAGDFWLNMYADSLSVGADLLSGTGMSKYVILRKMIKKAESDMGIAFDYVLLDLPPSFGALVRAAFYSADYYIVPCTSDNFSVYCVGLIGQMIPAFIRDWKTGLVRFKESNPHYTEFDNLGVPVFAGWIFNGFDTTRERRTQKQMALKVKPLKRKMVQADKTFCDRIEKAISDSLVSSLKKEDIGYDGVASKAVNPYQIGDIEDANVLIQNSLWQNVPIGRLRTVQQVKTLQDRAAWAKNQTDQIDLLRDKFEKLANNVETICI